MNEVEIEVFRADNRASRGITSDMIADLASSFDAANPVPLVIGHPKTDSPSHGEVVSFRADGNKLFATLKDVGQAIVDGIKSKAILNRSMAFFSPDHEANPTPGKLAPRHLGFLGGSAPGIPGMPRLDASALAFSADGETLEIDGDPAPALLFEATPTEVIPVHDDKEPKTMNPEQTPEAIAAAAAAAAMKAERDALDAERATFAAEQTATRNASNATIVDGLVAAGKVLPAVADDLKTVFAALDPTPLEFSAKDGEKSPAAALAAILSTGVKLAPINEGRQSPTGEFSATDKGDAKSITAAAKALQANDASLSFEAAVELVTAQEG